MNSIPLPRPGSALLALFVLVQVGAAAALSEPQADLAHPSARPLYYSANLAGHSLFAECNPGGTLACPCSLADVALLTNHPNYGVVISNAHTNHTYVNALGYRKFTDTFPNGQPVTLGQYRYSARVRLPVVPKANSSQINNADAVHLMVQFWDGRNALWNANSNTLEGALYWSLNPWETENYGHIRVYTYPLNLVKTGLVIPPDTNWHQFSLAVDLAARKYVSVSVDSNSVDLSSWPLCQVHHTDWGKNLALVITTESMAAYPGQNCTNLFTWPTYFQNIILSRPVPEQRTIGPK